MKKYLFLLICLALAGRAHADLFNLTLTQGSTVSRGYNSVIDLFDDYDNGRLDKIISTYNPAAASQGAVNFRGIAMNLDFDASYKLTFKVSSLGINKEFDGGSQKASFRLFKDYLKANKDDLLGKILRASVESTPFDAVAGNPNSLMSVMSDASFSRAGGNPLGSVVGYLSPSAAHHTFSFQGKDVDATTFSLPIGATFELGDGGWALLWDMPLTYTDIDGSVSYMAQMGLGLKVPVAKYWDLIPAVRVGAVGSEDMLSGGILYNGSLTSDISVPVGKWTIGMTNMFGVIRDYSVKVDDYEVEYDLQNEVYKNGVHARYDFSKKYAVGGSYAYTFYTGSDLYIDKYHEVELSLLRRLDTFFSGVALVGNYTFGTDYKAYRLGVDFLF